MAAPYLDEEDEDYYDDYGGPDAFGGDEWFGPTPQLQAPVEMPRSVALWNQQFGAQPPPTSLDDVQVTDPDLLWQLRQRQEALAMNPPGGPWEGMVSLGSAIPTAQEWEDAINVLASSSPELTEEEASDILLRQTDPSGLAKALAGTHGSLVRGAESLTSPGMGLTLVAGGALPMLGPRAAAIGGRLIAGGFGAHMTSQVGPAARQFGEAVGVGDTEQQFASGTDLAQLLGFAGVTGSHALLPGAPRAGITVPDEIRARMQSDNPQVAELERNLNSPGLIDVRTGKQVARTDPVTGRLIVERPQPERLTPNALQELSAAEINGRMSEQPRLDETLPAKEGGGEVPQGNLPPSGGAGRTLSPEEARSREIRLTDLEKGPVPKDPVERSNFETEFLERGQTHNQEQGLPAQMRAVSLDEPWIATVDEAGNVVVNRPRFSKWLDAVKPADRLRAVQSVFSEEGIHAVARKTIPDVEVGELWKGLTEPERALIRKSYGELDPSAVAQGTPADVLYGHEYLRRQMQRMLRQPVREKTQARGYEWLKESAIDAIERVILGVRRAVGSKSSKQLDAMLNRMKEHIDAAREAKGLPPAAGDVALSGAPRAMGEKKEQPKRIPVQIKQADGSVVEGEFTGYYDMRDMDRGTPISIGKMTEGGMSHGMLKPGEEIIGKIPSFEEWTEAQTKPKATETGGAPRALPKQAKETGEKLRSLGEKMRNAFGTRGNKRVAAATRDAADNQARIMSDQIRNGLVLESRKAFGKDSDKALDAVIAVIESGGDQAKLADFITQSTGKPGGEAAKAAAEFADKNWDAMQPLADRFRADTANQRAMEEGAGIKVEERQNYFPHVFDVNKLPGKGAEFFGSQGTGGSGKFRAQRTFNTIYDAVEAGYGPAIKTINAGDVIQQRVKNGAQRVLDKAWVDSMRHLDDPTTGTPLVTDVHVDPNGVMLAPPGYEVKTILNGPPVAVHQGYGKLIDALTGQSQVAALELAGLPVGEALLKLEAGIKHGTLLFDSFHASRMMQKGVFLNPENFGPQLLNPKTFGKKGVSLLEYADADLAEAVRQGDISPEIAKWVKANRPNAQLLIKRGLNVGQVHEALRSEIVKSIPLLGKYLSGFNGWVFQKVTRGALMEGGLLELERVAKANPSWSREKVADKVVKDLNTFFGNLGRQGVFKSKTFQDLSRLILLAPNWFESMARSEVGGYGQLGKAAISTVKGEPKVGSLGREMANGLLAYFVGTQLLNLITRGQPTWKNEEEGHSLDAWIPDVTGKSPGFFLSPMSVPAEITHDFLRYRRQKYDDSAEGAFQIAKNKMSPLSRAAYVMATGDTYKGKVIGTWNRAKEAGMSLVPVPIAAGGFFSGKPGQAQRQLTASAGFKTEPAESPKQQMSAIHSRWMANNEDPEVRAEFEREKATSRPPGEYRELDQALRAKDRKAAAKALDELRQVNKDKDIVKRMFPAIGVGLKRRPKPLFHESAEVEQKFLQTLTDKQREIYDRAMEDRSEEFRLFMDLWADRE